MMKFKPAIARSMLLRLTPLAALAAASLGAQAQEQKLDGQWHGGISIGGSAASGNTDSTALAFNAEATRATTADRINLYSLLNYASNKDAGVRKRTSELFRVGGRYDYNLSQSIFLFGGGEAETNKPGGVDSRYNLNTGSGYHLIRGERMTLRRLRRYRLCADRLYRRQQPQRRSVVVRRRISAPDRQRHHLQAKTRLVSGAV